MNCDFILPLAPSPWSTQWSHSVLMTAEPSILWAQQRYRGRLIRLGEMSEDDAQSLHRSTGGSTHTRKARATREAPERGQVRDDRINRTPVRDRPGALGRRRGS